MGYTYDNRKRTQSPSLGKEAAAPQPTLAALRSGAAQPTREQTGRRIDLPDAMREKMESAFGADLSAVKLYESEAVADAGAEAVTRGSDIAFAPGMLDFSSYGGQALLGHEISHVVSQARGEVTGGGFLNDRALEARADREGAMAAAGQQIAAPTAAMSGVSAAPAAGPMQAKKPWQKKAAAPAPVSDSGYAPFMAIDPGRAGKVNQGAELYSLVKNETFNPETESYQRNPSRPRPEAADLERTLRERYTGSDYRRGLGFISNGKDVNFSGLSLSRMISQMSQSLGEGYSNEEIIRMYDDLMAPHRSDLDVNDQDAAEAANKRFLTGLTTLKGMQYRQLKRMEATFGTLGTQMHPDDFSRLVGDRFDDYFHLSQDTAQMLKSAPKSVLDPENNPQDAEYKSLQDYYGKVADRNITYAQFGAPNRSADMQGPEFLESFLMKDKQRNPELDPTLMASIHGPSMDEKQEKSYLRGLRRRAGKKNSGITLFGKFSRK